MSMPKQLLVCTNFRANPNNPSCAGRHSDMLLDQLKTAFAKKNIAVEVVASPCMGYCNVGPNARLAPNGPFFHGVTFHGITGNNLAKILTAAKKFSAN